MTLSGSVSQEGLMICTVVWRESVNDSQLSSWYEGLMA